MSLSRFLPLALAAWLPATAAAQPAYPGAVTAAAFTPDGKTLVVAGADGNLRFLDAGVRELLALPAHDGGVSGLALSPDGKVLATAGGDRAVRLWDVARCLAPAALDE